MGTRKQFESHQKVGEKKLFTLFSADFGERNPNQNKFAENTMNLVLFFNLVCIFQTMELHFENKILQRI